MKSPITKSVTVPLNVDEAFALFTDGINNWWPGETYSVSASSDKKPRQVTLEPHKGGKITEVMGNGETTIWGEVIAYDPGVFLAFTWHPGKTADEATIVTISFKQTAEGTQCDLTHGGFAILGDLADAISTSYLTGWDMVLGCYGAAAKSPVLVAG